MSSKAGEDSPTDSSSRRDRAAIAAQACQTCRSRKSKCDEQRPKCSLCTRLGVDCVYREPQPTKKDKTLVHILSILERVESKVDRISSPPNGATSTDHSSTPGRGSDPTTEPPHASWEQVEEHLRPQGQDSQSVWPTDLISATSHLTAAHRILLWPSVYIMLTKERIASSNIDMQLILTEGTPWFTHLELEKHPKPLPNLPRKRSPSSYNDNVLFGINGLSAKRVGQLADAYFDTYNVLSPILDRDVFFHDFVGPVIRGGYDDDDVSSCIAMLVLALGAIALDGTYARPIEVSKGSRGGFRGGSVDEPPGLEIFDEARRRMGFVMTNCSLESVQIYLLQAIYYEACSRHMDFWRSCASASMSFQVFIRCEHIDWNSQRADLIKRVYWTCILNEDLYHLELDLPRTGIYTLEDQIPLPSFSQVRPITARPSHDQSPNLNYHFLAMIALRRLIARIHGSLHATSDAKSELSPDWPGPPYTVIKELARQLESWRTYLPQPLQWEDSEALSWPNTVPIVGPHQARTPLFTTDSVSPGTRPAAGPNLNFDIVTAHLRTRFYYAKYMIYRPFIFKALHFADDMGPDDISFCALAIKSMCLWPLAMAPCRDKKRLVPHLFTWTQNFMGMLLIFRMARENEGLRKICDERVNSREINVTVELLLDWIKDVKVADGVAEWAWNILEPLYRGFSNERSQ